MAPSTRWAGSSAFVTECLACRGSQYLPLPAWTRRCRSPDSVEFPIQRPKIAPFGVEIIQEMSVVLELRSLDQLFCWQPCSTRCTSSFRCELTPATRSGTGCQQFRRRWTRTQVGIGSSGTGCGTRNRWRERFTKRTRIRTNLKRHGFKEDPYIVELRQTQASWSDSIKFF